MSAAASVSDFELLEEVGRGAQGIVRRARVATGPRQGLLCAVKVSLEAAAETLGSLRRFRREAAILGRLGNAAFPAVFEVGVHGGRAYLALELIEGTTLRQRIASGKRATSAEICRWGHELASALVAAHSAGAVHHDVRPENIVIDAQGDSARLIDFGLALTTSTPAGGSGKVWTQAHRDLFALGTALYQAATGLQWVGALEPAAAMQALGEQGPDGEAGRIVAALLAGRSPVAEQVQLAWPTVGLADEQAKIRALAEEARTAMRVCLITGAAGSGKTRLAETLLQQTTLPIFRHACRSWAPVPFGAVRDLIEALIEHPVHGEVVRREATEFAPLLQLLSAKLKGALGPAREVPRSEDTEHVYAEGLAKFLDAALRAVGSCWVYIDDVHWLDTGSRLVLRRLLDRDDGPAALFLLCGRAGLDDGATVQRLVARLPRPIDLELNLGPLEPAATRALIQAFLGRLPIPTEHLESVALLCDGNAFRALEILRSLLDHGLLAPHWGQWRVDVGGLSAVELSNSTSAILGRRMAALAPEVVECLQAAAIVGNAFDITQVERLLACGDQLHSLQSSIGDGLIVPTERPGCYRFVHDLVRQSLLERLPDTVRTGLHARHASNLAKDLGLTTVEMGPSVRATLAEAADEAIFSLAYHTALCSNQLQPLCYHANAEAGRRAFERFDNSAALSHFAAAARAADEGNLPSDPQLEYLIAEAHWRRGDVRRSRELFELLSETRSDTENLQARCLARLAWIQEAQFDTAGAQVSLARAFAAFKTSPARTSVGLAGGLLARTVKAPRPPCLTRELTSDQRSKLELLCALHYQRARICVYTGDTKGFVNGVLLGCETGERLGASPGLCQSYLILSLLLVTLKQRRRGLQYADLALSMAKQLGDPVAQAHCYQLSCVIAGWAGELTLALERGATCLHDFEHWMAIVDYLSIGASQVLVESLRGRDSEAWGWVEQMLSKALRYEGEPIWNEAMYNIALAAAHTVRRADEYHATFERLRQKTLKPSEGSVFELTSYGSWAKQLVEQGRLAELEELVARFEKGNHNPKRVHITVCEYYLQVLTARINACLTGSAQDETTNLAKLRRAVKDMHLAARIPMLEAHALVGDVFLALFEKRTRRMTRLLIKAEALGVEQSAPVILYWVARARAHLLQRQGNLSAALAQAQLAAGIAKQNESASKLQWISSEFDLVSSASSARKTLARSSSSSAGEQRSLVQRHLRALLEISRATAAELTPEHQARAVLDEVISALRAARGFLLLRSPEGQANAPRLRVVAGRDAEAVDLEQMTAEEHLAVEEAVDNRALVVKPTGGNPAGRSGVVANLISAPLVVKEQLVGAVCLTGSADGTMFDTTAGELLHALLIQVPLALELGRALRDREALQEDLKHAQRLEALGRLVGGIAHDFNNMLAAIQVSVESALATEPRSEVLDDDLLTIQSASERASKFTRQLLAFSRRQALDARPVDLNATVQSLVPMMSRLLGEDVRIALTLEPGLSAVCVDSGQVEQVLVNLAVNARHAMPNGGTLTVATQSTVIGENDPRERPAGSYVALRVTDTGHGMNAETKARAFEPFFTTKSAESGSGLGLSMVYGFVRQSGGHIDLDTSVGKGTTFTLYIPMTELSIPSARPAISQRRMHSGSESILLVEDEPLVRQSLTRVLRRLGYIVVVASDGREALSLAELNPGLQLVITDVIMPGLNGVEMVKELKRRGIRPKVLYLSGYTDGVLPQQAHLRGESLFLQKPVANEELASAVRTLLDGSVGSGVRIAGE